MKYIIFAAGLCLAACNNTPVPAAKDSLIAPVEDTIVSEIEEGTIPVDTAARITFPEFKLTVYPMVTDPYEQQRLDQLPPETDTAFFTSDLGQTMEGALISITSDQLTDIKIEEQVETSMCITTEEYLYQLSDWKHAYSEWEELSKNGSGIYETRSYTREELSVFPDVTLDELKAAVKAAGGDEWLHFIKDVKTVKDEPLEVLGDRYLLRVSGKRKSDGKIISKIIVITLPLGC